ncbi:PfaD family polyunsaturated fatty acid/polyketide biosynthesis protein [Desulfobacterales bacterium HSG16]|nr:PfaD family polyunsaturated fatty acid/polyketide biosynthesis protein [Desulfobacterales bacterium HSG16]
MTANQLSLSDSYIDQNWGWPVQKKEVSFDSREIKKRLSNLENPCYIVKGNGILGISTTKTDMYKVETLETRAYAPAFQPEQLGDPGFKTTYGTKYCYYAGAMANGIASEEMVIALGKAGFLASFGAGGLVPERIEVAIQRIQQALPNGPYCFNLIHSPAEPALERGSVDLYLKYGVRCVEAAAFIALTPNVVRYRVAGLSLNADNEIEIKNRVIAKISRREVAAKFMEPPPEKIVQQLLADGLITEQQARLATKVPMADDITAEADSGGHTDNRPLVSLLPSIIALRDEIQAKNQYPQPVRVGAGGGIGTPEAALATFAMGAAYVVTGTVNQGCVEAGACEHTKKLLAQADMADVAMAPASDMFEMGVKLQVLRRGSFFPMRAQKLYDLYNTCNSIEEIPADVREKLEKQVFRKNLDTIWKETKTFFEGRDPSQIVNADKDPKRKMALIFRWYLGLASRWSNIGEKGREMDYQIWCGPCIGAFNAWVKNSYLEDVENRRVVDVAGHILRGAAFLYRIQMLRNQGVIVPPKLGRYVPERGWCSIPTQNL